MSLVITMISSLLSALALSLSLAGPSTPTIAGPRVSEATRVAYVFHARGRGVPSSRIRFRCAVDSAALHSCSNPYRVTLAVGIHTLRVRAVDPKGHTSPTSKARVQILEPRAPEIRVGSAPLNAIAVGGTVWTENYGDGTVSAVDVASGKARSIQVGGQPGGIAYGAGSIWVSDLGSGILTRVDPAGRIVARVSLGGQAAGLAFSGGQVYVADYSGGLTRVDAETNQVLGRTPLPGNPEAVAVGFGRVWVTNQDGTIATLDPRTGAVDGPAISVANDVADVSIGTDAVWAVALYGKTLARIDPVSRQIVARIPTPGQGSGVLATADSVWISNYDQATVSRVDPARNAVIRTYRVGTQPRGLAESGGAIWVANQASSSLSRIER